MNTVVSSEARRATILEALHDMGTFLSFITYHLPRTGCGCRQGNQILQWRKLEEAQRCVSNPSRQQVLLRKLLCQNSLGLCFWTSPALAWTLLHEDLFGLLFAKHAIVAHWQQKRLF